jgi:AcrR family transcriptional regulator
MTAVEESPPSASQRRRKPRGEYAKTEETRAAVLDAALEVFAEGGFRGGFLREIAERAAMSEAGLLYHFPNKASLLAAVLERRDLQSYNIAPMDTTAGEASVRGLIELARYNAATPGVIDLYCTLSAEATSEDHPAHDYFVRRYERTYGLMMKTFELLAAEGQLAAGITPPFAARSTIAMMDGLQVQWLFTNKAVDMPEQLRLFFRTITTLDL